MYPFDSVRWAWDQLWHAVHALAAWTPAELAHSLDVHARWVDPDCVVNHVCGWPLARWYSDSHHVVGTFSLTIPEAEGHLYRSVLLSPHDVPLAELVHEGARAAVNSRDSLSGWVSLLNATVGGSATWPGHRTFTSSHHESLKALATGHADLACIDSWSLALIEREEPQLVSGLHRVGLGPLIPSPAITVHRDLADRAEALADAFQSALAAPEQAPVRDALFVDGFVRTTIDDYLPTLALCSEDARTRA